MFVRTYSWGNELNDLFYQAFGLLLFFLLILFLFFLLRFLWLVIILAIFLPIIFVELIVRFIDRLESTLSFDLFYYLVSNFRFLIFFDAFKPRVSNFPSPWKHEISVLIDFSQLLFFSHVKGFHGISKIFNLSLQWFLGFLLGWLVDGCHWIFHEG